VALAVQDIHILLETLGAIPSSVQLLVMGVDTVEQAGAKTEPQAGLVVVPRSTTRLGPGQPIKDMRAVKTVAQAREAVARARSEPIPVVL